MASRRGITLLEVLVVIAILGVLIGLTVPAVQRARDAAARAHCANNLRQIGLALHQYHNGHRSFPPGVSYQDGASPYPFMSWNTRLLPFLEQDGLWAQAKAAFAQNAFFQAVPPHHGLSTVMPAYACPSDKWALAVRDLGSVQVAFTSYLGVSGTNQFRKDGILFLDSRVRFAEVTDGTSHTLLAGERPPSADGVFGWWYAGMGQDKDGSADMILGARERNVGSSTSTSNCPAGPYEFGPGRFDNQCDLFHFWSPHPGGAYFLFADGSVRFLAYSARSVLPGLATRARGEAVELP